MILHYKIGLTPFLHLKTLFLNIQLGNEVDIYDHPNLKRYPGQKVSVVLIENYAYLVPFNENEIFLKTIIPSRKATRIYVGDTND